ncbi:dipeptide ABC transporter ATP-binding protein [Ponticoccus alexandrii]|uniref:Dipeptide ABC transporter ATP-binding protein n=1 Tax=Ponticoccus alexandrii TaxID=1943633 RepID=A0ABX7FG82_9RHOB|nr:ABC transporter ATP-binding protein [Ponticoccus alexandrii]ETA52256.1 peptide ABC transporter ATP-binding protein [Rhodobacteraceae bacterium PD-2]QRF68932.1 dipeptide ABC transporter ATP-binding protein [Ponticoccus alexandrii]
MTHSTLLEVRDLTLKIKATEKTVVDAVSLDVRPGEVVAIVGESGSGKTQVARAVMDLTNPAIARASGSSTFQGKDFYALTDAQKRAIRGKEIGMVFQEPMTSLNPSLTIGQQLAEGLALHTTLSAEERRARIADMLERVGISDPDHALAAYPHEFSGGMRQRIMLASVMLLKPALLIADEPTTALDAVIQRDVMELMVELTREVNTAVLLISHDLPMVARYADHILVMKSGEVVERGTSAEVLSAPKHDYTRKLLAALPFRPAARSFPEGTQPVLSVENLVVEYAGRQRMFRRTKAKRALKGVSVTVRPNEVLAIVGGSGSGKTTLGRAVTGLLSPTSGVIRFEGRPVGARKDRDYRANCQMVFQDPYSSLNPRMSVGDLVREPLRLEPNLSRREKRARTELILEEVGLGGDFYDRFPHQLSGGQRQRIAIARAIIRRPRLLIADEPVSALDVTVRAQILALFADLQKRHGFSSLFISHDLGVVEQVSDRIIVMQHGEIVEQGTRDQIFDAPAHPYTRQLLAAIPALKATPQGGIEMTWRGA